MAGAARSLGDSFLKSYASGEAPFTHISPLIRVVCPISHSQHPSEFKRFASVCQVHFRHSDFPASQVWQVHTKPVASDVPPHFPSA